MSKVVLLLPSLSPGKADWPFLQAGYFLVFLIAFAQMGSQVVSIHIRNGSLKFSAAHMTVFPDGKKEGLHGHNYTVSVCVELLKQENGEIVPFSLFKKILQPFCQEWDERILMAKYSPHLKVSELEYSRSEEVEFFFCNKRYVLPRDEVIFLPIYNVSVEELSGFLGEKFRDQLDSQKFINSLLSIQLTVDETNGQGGSYFWRV